LRSRIRSCKYAVTHLLYDYREDYLKSQLPSHSHQYKTESEVQEEAKKRDTMHAKERILKEQKDLYAIPVHLDVDKLKEDRRVIDQTQWMSGLMEVKVGQDRKIKNVEEAEKLRL
jgi:hypothetical protein